MCGNKKKDNSFAYYSNQLKHAHNRNTLVDNHRFLILQFFLVFHGVIITALLLKPLFTSEENGQLPGELPPFLAFGIIMIGVLMFGVYYSQCLYMNKYKHWIKVLEYKLIIDSNVNKDLTKNNNFEFTRFANNSGTLYHDSIKPKCMPELTTLFSLLLICFINVGIASTILLVNKIPKLQILLIVLIGLILYFLLFVLIILFFRNSNNSTDSDSDSDPNCSHNREKS